jgi:integrase
LADERKAKDLSGINLKFIDAYRRLRTDEGAQPKTRYTETVIIRQLVNFALSRDMLTTDPLKGLSVKKPRPTPQPCWTAEEVRRILAASADDIRPALMLLAETGLRFGEMAWLTWEDVDLQAEVLRIRPKDGWRPKTGDQRAVPLSPTLLQLLASIPRKFRWVHTMPASRQNPESGRQWTERRLLAGLKRVLKKLSLPGKIHTFRHSFISAALLNGTPPAIVRKWVGHVDPRIIDLYTHVHDVASQEAMRRLSEALLARRQQDEGEEVADADSAQNQHTEKE